MRSDEGSYRMSLKESVNGGMRRDLFQNFGEDSALQLL
jgi:hypothetical protein